MKPTEHPAFTLAKSLPEPWRSRFPKSCEKARSWQPHIRRCALAMRVLVVMRTRIECAWAAYIDAVPGFDHDVEAGAVLDHGEKLPEELARILFPEIPKEVPYAD